MNAAVQRKDLSLAPAALKRYEKNARTHSKDQVQQIVRSIGEYGFTNPILIDENHQIIAGHGRLEAALQIGLEKVPCVMLTGLTEAQKRALVLADNQLALNAGWDKALLTAELSFLKENNYDISLIGFPDVHLTRLFPVQAKAGEDDIPAEAPPTSVRGDMWLLGRHRIRCGDSTDADDVKALLGDLKPHLMVTDPPYGVEYDPQWRVKAGRNKDTARSGVVKNDNRADWREAWALFPGNIAYVWHGALHAAVVQESLEVCGYAVRAQIIWDKGKMVFGRGDYHWQHEPCLYAVKGTGNWTGDRSQTTVWHIDNLNAAHSQKAENSRTNHSTQKPVECMRRPIINNSSEGQCVYDPFSGSGSTLIAAETTGRACLGMELDPVYVDIIVRRWEAFTGKMAVHAVTGEAFGGTGTARPNGA